jgi:hypothetical protein
MASNKDTNEYKRSADQFTNKWNSKILFNLKEPILSSYSRESEAIRFIWLRTFNEPIVVRLNNTPEGLIANLKALINGALMLEVKVYLSSKTFALISLISTLYLPSFICNLNLKVYS